PGPLTPLPLSLKKLQVGGTQFPRLHQIPQQNEIVTVELTPYLDLSTGKAAAQVGHAAQLAFERLTSHADQCEPGAAATSGLWCRDDFRNAVLTTLVDDWYRQQVAVSVVDAALTDIAQTAETARAYW